MTTESCGLRHVLQWNRIVQNIHRLIKNLNRTHSHKLSHKLSRLLDESKWKHIRRPEMLLKLTNFQFSNTEIEALSQGLIFAIGIYKNITANTILDNCQHCYTDFSKGVIQGIILAAISQANESSLPKIITIQNVYTTQPKPEHHHLSCGQKWWRCNHAQRYIDKMNSLLEDSNIYIHIYIYIYIYIYTE